MKVKWWDSSGLIVDIHTDLNGKKYKVMNPLLPNFEEEFICVGAFRYKVSTAVISDIENKKAMWLHDCNEII